MAIGPQEAGQITKAELEQLTHVEQAIDASLRESYRPGHEFRFYLDGIIKERVKQELVSRYAKAGWVAKIKPAQDQRDTDTLVLTEGSESKREIPPGAYYLNHQPQQLVGRE